MRRRACGSGFSETSQDHFGCPGARNNGETICGNLTIHRCERLEAVVLDGLRTRLTEPAACTAFADAFIVEWNRQVAEDAVKTSDIGAEHVKVWRPTELERRKAELASQMAEPAASPPWLHPNVVFGEQTHQSRRLCTGRRRWIASIAIMVGCGDRI